MLPMSLLLLVDPTLAELAGTGPPHDDLDGVSLVPFLKHPHQLTFPTPLQQGTQNKTLAFSQYPVLTPIQASGLKFNDNMMC